MHFVGHPIELNLAGIDTWQANMKNQLFFSGMLSALLIIFAPRCPANIVDQLICDSHPFIGIDAQDRHMGFREDFGGNLFKKNLPQLDAYVGVRFLQYFGLQVGYQESKTKPRTANFGPGDIILGIPLLPGEDQIHYSETRIRGTHLDLLGFFPVCLDWNLELFGSVGITRNALALEDRITNFGGEVVENPLVRTYDVKKTGARASIGIQKIFCQHIGIRGLVVWENTSRFQNLRSLEVPDSVSIVNARRSLNYGLGIFAIL